jgi:hypothetical protein
MIGLIKQQLWRTFEGKKLTHEETLTILAEAVQKINSRALTCNPRPEGEPLCVQDLMLGRARRGQAEVKFESGSKLTKRFENVQRTQQEFWKRWIEEVFPEKLRISKWKREKRDLKVGDIVLRKDETAAGQTYKYAKVVKVHASTDDRVRAADIEYKLPGESVFRITTRPIHKLVLVIPVEEQGPAGDQAEEPLAPARAEAIGATTAPPLEMNSQAVRRTESVVEKAEGLAKAEIPPPRNEVGMLQTAPGPEERALGKNAVKQTWAVIVAAPKEEAKMVDIGAKPKKRGRPRKNLLPIHRIRTRGVSCILRRECVRTLWTRAPYWEREGEDPIAVTKSVS